MQLRHYYLDHPPPSKTGLGHPSPMLTALRIKKIEDEYDTDLTLMEFSE